MSSDEEPDICQWTDWSSCDFFCDTPRVANKTREKVSEGSNGKCRNLDQSVSTSIEVGQCAINHNCTGEQRALRIFKVRAYFIQLPSSLVPGWTPPTATRLAARTGSISSWGHVFLSARTFRLTFPAKIRPLLEQGIRYALQVSLTVQVTPNIMIDQYPYSWKKWKKIVLLLYIKSIP